MVFVHVVRRWGPNLFVYESGRNSRQVVALEKRQLDIGADVVYIYG
jgi:hypothetical protein